MPTRPLIETPDDIRLNEQDEIQQILGPPPNWIIRYGVTVVFLFFLGLVILASIIHYRDVVTARGFLTTATPPAKIIARTDGRVATIQVKDLQTVTSGELLVTLESTTNYQDALLLEQNILQPVDSAIRPGQVLQLKLPNHLQLGYLQPYYSTLREQLTQLKYQFERDQTLQLIQSKENEITTLQEVNQALSQQLDTLRKEVLISKNRVDTLRRLLQGGFASAMEVKTAETNHLQYQRELRNKEIDLFNNRIQVSQLASSITNLSQGKDEKINGLWINLKEEARKLKAELQDWKQLYVLTAPVAGQVSFTNMRSEQQFVTTGATLMTIVPPSDFNQIIALAFLPATGMGKVAPGMDAKIRLDAFNYKEFGVLEGTVSQIGLAPEQNQEGEPYFRMQVVLDNTMTTTYRKKLLFKPEMTATIRVLTEDRSLLARLLDRIYNWRLN